MVSVVRFYHVTRSTVDRVVCSLCDKSSQQGWRVLVICEDTEMLGAIDRALWTYDPESFLPHDIASPDDEANPPILLGSHQALLGTRDVAIAVLPAKISWDISTTAERFFVVFDDTDEQQMQAARQYWRSASASGLRAEYVSEESGGWVTKQVSSER